MSPNVTFTISYVSIAPRVTETGSFPARPAGAGSGGLRPAYDLNASSESRWRRVRSPEDALIQAFNSSQLSWRYAGQHIQ